MSRNATPEGREPPTDSEHARIVAEVLEDQARRKAVRESASAKPDEVETSFFVQVGLLVTGTFFFYLLFFSPTWIAPTAAEPVSTAQVETGLRFQIVLAARHVEAFREREGRLPRSLDEIEEAPRDGVDYRRLDAGTFEITAAAGDADLRYVSTQALEDFADGVQRRVLGGAS